MNKYTEAGLPIVNQSAIIVALRDEIQSKGPDISFEVTYQEIKEILEQENPALLEYLNHTRNRAPNIIAKVSFTGGFAEAYKMLRRQGEINKLEELIE